MSDLPLLDSAGRRRSMATMPGYHAGRSPRNKGMHYPADPPSATEIITVMRHAGDDPSGVRLRPMIVILWRAGLRVQEASICLDRTRGAASLPRSWPLPVGATHQVPSLAYATPPTRPGRLPGGPGTSCQRIGLKSCAGGTSLGTVAPVHAISMALRAPSVAHSIMVNSSAPSGPGAKASMGRGD